MNPRLQGAIDCDVHPNVPGVRALMPYLDDYWRDMIEVRGIEGFNSRAYPPLVPASARPDWRGDQIQAAETVERAPGGPSGSLAARRRHPELPLRRPAGQRRGPRGRAVLGGQRLARGRVARQGPAPCRLDRDPDAEPRARRRGDFPLGGRSALRAGADAGDARSALWPALLVADLRAGRAPGPADRAASRQRLPPRDHRGRLAAATTSRTMSIRPRACRRSSPAC